MCHKIIGGWRIDRFINRCGASVGHHLFMNSVGVALSVLMNRLQSCAAITAKFIPVELYKHF